MTITRLKDLFPVNYSIYYTEDEANQGFAESVSILSYVDAEQFAAWQESTNSSIKPSRRSIVYQDFKTIMALLILDKVAERFPEIAQFKKSMKIATPLSYRDYQGSVEGSLYGMKKDVFSSYSNKISTKTRIPNLFLTGQNINFHGIYGVSLTAILTASELVGLDYLIDKINA